MDNFGITDAFHEGHYGTPGHIATLNGHSMPEQSNMPSSFTPQSVLDIGELNPTGNGMSAQDKSNILPGGYSLGNANGASQQDFNEAKIMKYLGDAVI